MENVSRGDYFAAAIAVLAEGGDAALTIAALCDRLGVTKGSFYHHFGSGAEFHRALLEHWERDGVERLHAALDGVTDPIVRIGALKRLGNSIDHDTESAIRSWGRSFAPAADTQRRVDSGRERVLADAFVSAGIPAERAATLARIGSAILIGTQQLEHPVDTESLGRAFDEYERWLVAVIADSEAPVSGGGTGSGAASAR